MNTRIGPPELAAIIVFCAVAFGWLALVAATIVTQ